MKQKISENILKKASILLVVSVLVLSTVAVTADTSESPEIMLADEDYISQSQQTNTFDPDWLHFDDGTNANAIGLTTGGTFEFAARFTPDELAEWAGYNISTVRHFHGWVDGTPFQMSGKIKIYNEGTSAKPGSLITSEPFDVYDNDWFDVELSNPVQITGDKDIWVSVEATHQAEEFPAGCDGGPIVDGKGGWICLSGAWSQISAGGFNVNWNIWIEITGEEPPDTVPPVTNCALKGEMEDDVYVSDVTVTLTATDDQSGVNYTMYRLDNGDNQIYINPFIVSELGEHIVYYYSVDNADNVEDEKICTFVRGEPAPKSELEISIAGFIGVKATIKNVGDVDANDVEWKITVRGGVLDRIDVNIEDTTSELTVDDSITVRQVVFGFGNIDIRVTVEASNAEEKVTKKATAFVIGIFVIGITIEE